MKQTRQVGSLLLFGCLGLPTTLAALPPAESAQTPANSPIRLPEGLADAEGRIGYFASADDGIDCIDLANGRVLWHTHEAQRPLVLAGDSLLVQAGTKRNRLRILRLDLKRDGECDFESDPLIFPAWVVTGEAPGHAFAAKWHRAKHHLILDWEATAWYTGKARPTPEEEQAAHKHSRGIAHIDLRTGQIDILPPQDTQPSPQTPLPEQLEQKALRWQRLVGQHWKALALEEEKGQQYLVLHSWDRQKETQQQSKELMRGKRLLVRTTIDEEVLCLRDASPSPDESISLTQKKATGWWWLFSVQTGKLLGRIPEEAGMHTIAMISKRVFYLVPGTLHGSLEQPRIQPQTLRVVDLVSGKKLWERPVAGKWIAPPPRQSVSERSHGPEPNPNRRAN